MFMDVIMKKQKQHCFVDISQAAHMLGCDRFYVNVLIWKGSLKGTKCGGKWRIPTHSVRAYIAGRQMK